MEETSADRFRRLESSLEETAPAEAGADASVSSGVQRSTLPRSSSSTEPDSTLSPAEAGPDFPAEKPRSRPRRRRVILRSTPPEIPPAPPPESAVRRRRPRGRRSCGSCLLQAGLAGLFGLLVVLFIASGYAVFVYFQVAATLPPVEDLQARAAQFETTRIFDRDGNLLYEILDPTAGRRTYTPLAKMSPYMVAAIVATEDERYYSHPGFDAWGVARAFVQNAQSGETVSGASTITQQLARMLLLSPEERTEITYFRKVREALLAMELTRRYSKDMILELYLNEVNFGNLAYGVEAAAETYFHTSADKLTLAQASFLAGLPQAPSVYDVYSNREATFERQRQVLVLMMQASEEQNCIYVSNSVQPVCVTPQDAGAAWAEMQNYAFSPVSVDMRYPHWVDYIRTLLEASFDPQTIYRSGFQVYTTLDPRLQDAAQAVVQNKVVELADKHIAGGALVAIKPSTGEILAMVGSPDYYAQPAGQVNMAIRPRQPGSSIKPLTYLAAFEKGWTAATLIWDVPSEFPPSNDPNDPNPYYKPVNYDGRFHGGMTVRTALANSFNIPAVKTLQFVGVYDDPATPQAEGLVAFARRMGITSLNRPDYGLALTLGGGEVTPLELTSAYAVIANNGVRVPPVAITRITTFDGKPVFEYQPPQGEPVLRPEHAFLMSSILSDGEARIPMFGANSILNLPFPAAVKTGTTNDFRDNWTVGYTPDLAVGVWVGNPDNSPMEGTTGVTGAAPIWAEFMTAAIQQLTGGTPSGFQAPPGIVQRLVCSISGTEPSKYCPSTRAEFFVADQLPLPPDRDLWRDVWLDTFTQLRASAACSEFLDQDLTIAIADAAARRWLVDTSEGREWARKAGFPDPIQFYPDGECAADSARPIIAITSLTEGQTVTGPKLEIQGRAGATKEFDRFVLQYGKGGDPKDWHDIVPSSKNPVLTTGRLAEWDLSEVDDGPLTVRLVVYSRMGGKAEIRVHLTLRKPTPTPTPTPSNTPTPTPTNTPTPTMTPTPSSTPTPTLPATSTPTSTSTLTPTPVVVIPTDTPSPTETPP